MGRRAFFGGRCFFFDRFDSTGAKKFPPHMRGGAKCWACVWYAAFWCGLCSPFTAAQCRCQKELGASESSPPHCIKKAQRARKARGARLSEARSPAPPRAPPRGSPTHLGAPESAGAPASRTEGKAKQGTQHQPKQGASKRAGPVGRDDDASGGAPAPFAARRRRGGAAAARRHAR